MAEETQQTEEVAANAQAPVEEKKPVNKVDAWFGITKSGSNFKTEIVAGLTTFMAMVYILMVNGAMFSEGWVGLSYGAAYIATAIGAIIGTLLMALYAKMPLAQAPGMGLNAFIVYTLLLNYSGLTFANCMLFTLIDGVIFVLLTVTGLRQKIFEAIPAGVRHAIPVGIGLFIAFIGMQNASVIVNENSTLVTFASFNILNIFNGSNAFMTYTAAAGVGGMLPAFLAIFGVIAIAIMSKKGVKGAILWGILGTAVVFYILAAIAYGCGVQGAVDYFAGISLSNPFDAFGDWGTQSVGKVFTDGFNFDGYLAGGGTPGTLVVLIITTALSFCMIDMFDTIGTLYGACSKGNLLEKDGTPIRMNQMMLSDAIATCTGAISGTNTVTTFVESSSGVAAGGRTGLTSLVTAICFILAMFLSPIAQLIPECATATALIYVGVLMMTSVVKVDWEDPADAIVAFLTFIVMALGYSISKGIGIGIITFIIVKLFTGKVREISIPTWVIGAIFLATFLLT